MTILALLLTITRRSTGYAQLVKTIWEKKKEKSLGDRKRESNLISVHFENLLTAMLSCCLMPCPLLSCLVLCLLLGSGSKAQCPSQGDPNRPPPAASTSSSGGTLKYPQDSRET